MVHGLLVEASRGFHPFALVNSGVPSIDYPTKTTPTVTVQYNRDPAHGGCGGGGYFRIPITPGFKVENQIESHAASYLPNGAVYDYYQLTSPGMTPIQYPGYPRCRANSNWQTTLLAYHRKGWRGSGWDKWGATASHAIEGAGAVRYIDMKQRRGSTWPHALAISIDNTSNGSVYPRFVRPATGGDGVCGGGWAPVACNESIPQGARLQLDPSINCKTWPSLARATEWKRVMCRTLQRYGVFVTSTGRGIYTEWNKASDKGDCAPASCYQGLLGLNWSSHELPYDLYSHFRVLGHFRVRGKRGG
jgi:hypothetical protein